MKVLNLTITDNILSKLQAINEVVSSKVLPNTKSTFDNIVYNIESQWKAFAVGNGDIANLQNPFPSTRLMSSIHSRFLGDFVAVVGSDSPLMNRIINGSPEYDMKKTYPYGKKSRVSKKGVPYLIIPFRWGTPNKNNGKRYHFASTAPAYLVDILRTKEAIKSVRINSTHTEPNASGEPIERSEYIWGSRIKLKNIPLVYKDAHNATGMVRMANSGGYFTFRIISVNSDKDKWIKKAKNGMPILDALITTNQRAAQEAISSAVYCDIQSLL